jgi:hypothetical protein
MYIHNLTSQFDEKSLSLSEPHHFGGGGAGALTRYVYGTGAPAAMVTINKFIKITHNEATFSIHIYSHLKFTEWDEKIASTCALMFVRKR